MKYLIRATYHAYRTCNEDPNMPRQNLGNPYMLNQSGIPQFSLHIYRLRAKKKTFFDPNIWIESWPPFSAFGSFQCHSFTSFWVFSFSVLQFLSFSASRSRISEFSVLRVLVFFCLTPAEPCPYILMELIVFRDWKTEREMKNQKSILWSLYLSL